jgi:hypothetical protein
MKALLREYLASLKEREELDAILPDLLSELGYSVYSKPRRGTTQYGVDIAAVGKDDDGERKIFLFTVKPGDLTRQAWDGAPQSVRPSLNEIRDAYIPTRIPKRYQDLKIVICLCVGGEIQEQVRAAVTGYTAENTSSKISYDEWNGDKLAGLLLQGILREEILPKPLRSHFQKAVAMVDQPDVAFRHFSLLVGNLHKSAIDNRSRVRAARQMYICLWILFVWSRDAGNIGASYSASELVLLNMWDLLRPHLGKNSKTNKAISSVLAFSVQLHLTITDEFLGHKILPHVATRDAISMAVESRSSVDVNLRVFELLGLIAMQGLWFFWMAQDQPDQKWKAAVDEKVLALTTAGFRLIENNGCLLLPLQDQQSIEITIFLVLAGHSGNADNAMLSWLHEMVERLNITIRTHGQYPCVFTNYRDLVEHPRARTDDYLKEATSGSTLIPLLAAFLSALGDKAALKSLVDLKETVLQHTTLQLWLPDEDTEDRLYAGDTDHGTSLTDLPLSASGSELLNMIRDACAATTSFASLSAVQRSYWPIILTACRHYRLPVPPQFWIELLLPETDDAKSVR